MENEKSLKKFTDFEKIDTCKKVRSYLEKYPESKEEIADFLLDKLNVSLNKKDGKEGLYNMLLGHVMRDEDDKEALLFFRNQTYEINRDTICTFIHNNILEYGRFPSISVIADGTKLSRTTIYKHFKSGAMSKYGKTARGKMEYMATLALEKLYLVGIQDRNVSALKSFIELSGAINKPPSQKVNNYIQINNVKLSQEDIKELPHDVVAEIEQLLKRKNNQLKT